MAPSNAPLSLGGMITMIIPAGLVWALTPFSWILVPLHHFYFTSATRHHLNGQFWYQFLIYHAYFELPFSIFLLHLSRKAQKHKKLEHAPVSEMRKLFLDCLEVGAKTQERQVGVRKSRTTRTTMTRDEVDQIRGQAMATKFRQWFVGRPKLEEIKMDNAREWVAWAIADKAPKDVDPKSEEGQLIEEGMGWLQHRMHVDFEKGYNPDVKAIRLTMDPVRTAHRPFGYYVVCNSVTFLTYAWLWIMGCRFEKFGECSYITREGKPIKRNTSSGKKSTEGAGLPIFFVHGLGIGIGQCKHDHSYYSCVYSSS